FVKASRAFENPFIVVPPVHLGPSHQDQTVPKGYNQQREDEMLAAIDWPADGYQLFRVAGSPSDASSGWFGCPFGSNCFCLRRTAWQKLGGFDARFQLVCGGLVNLDFFCRAAESTEMDYVMLLGEASFHQTHGGVPHPAADYVKEYESIRG